MTSFHPEVIYIGGYGRSGSTILDIILSQQADIVGCGELHFLFEDWLSHNRRCSCGALYADCSFWGGLQSTIDIAEAALIIKAVEGHGQLQKIREGMLPAGLRRRYETIQEALFAYIYQSSGARVILDSSKTKSEMAARPLAIDRLTSSPVSMIHLVRSGQETVQTILEKGSNWSIEGHRKRKRLRGIKTAYGWRRANEWALMYEGLLGPGKYTRVRYEDLQAQPETILKELEHVLNTPLPDAIKSLTGNQPLAVGHRVGGNRIRFQPDLAFNQTPETLKSLHPIQELAFQWVTGGLSRSLGYQ